MMSLKPLWAVTILVIALFVSPLVAQTPLTEIEQLKLDIIRLQQEILVAKQDWTSLLANYQQCMVANLEHSKTIPTMEYAKLVEQMEKDRPGFSWDGTKFVPKDKK